MTAGHYHIGIHDDPSSIDAAAWDRLLARQPAPTPFMRHAYLDALHRSGSAREATGWAPRFVSLTRDGELVGACPAYLKTHSWGEYVFDWAWADAYRRHRLPYYPKLVCAVPFTPVAGTRLMATDDAARRALVDTLQRLASDRELSSAHLLFAEEADVAAAAAAGWMRRRTVQFHWRNRRPQGYADFADFLAGLQRDKRKKIQQERRRVAEAGVVFSSLEGDAIDAPSWRFFHRCYEATYAAHHATPYLSAAFFETVGRTMPGHWLMFVAERAGRRIAASLIAIDRERGAAFGRYWGSLEPVGCLHFEACYYQPLAWCIDHGFDRFEGGAQGEHKMSRGLLPVVAESAHWLDHPAFADAVGRYLEQESEGVDAYVDELDERNPFRREPADGR